MVRATARRRSHVSARRLERAELIVPARFAQAMRTGRLNSRGLGRLRLPSACCSNVSNRSLQRICAYSRAGQPKGFVPCRANAAQKRRIDDPPAERIDESHVKPRQTADAAHLNREIE